MTHRDGGSLPEWAKRELIQLRTEVRNFKAPPKLEIVKHDMIDDPHPYMTLLTFTWQNYQHRTMVSNEVMNVADYRTHIIRQGVEACVRANAEAHIGGLIVTEETYSEMWARLQA
jgi:hypothetical protein